jgi:hypothetical protein
MSLFNQILNYSVPVIARKNGIEFFASGFFIVKKNKDETMQLFLITCYSLVAKTDMLTFGVMLNNDYKWLSMEYVEKDIKHFEKNEYDLARINVSKLYDYLTEEEIDQIKVKFLYKENIISTEIIKNTGILEDLFLISNAPIDNIKAEYTCTPIVTKCQNATRLDCENLGFFFITLPREDWRLGSPVFSSFNDKIELIGMVSSLGAAPNDLCSVTPASAIMELLKRGKEII